MRRLITAPAARTWCVLAAVVAVVLVAGCSKDDAETGDPLQIVENPVPAKAADSPAPDTEPAGTVLGIDGGVSSVRADPASNTLAAARTGSAPAVLLYDLDDPAAGPRSSTGVPGEVTDFTFTEGAVLASVPSAGTVMRIPLRDPSGAERIDVRGKPSATARQGSRTLIALRDRKTVLVRDGDTVTKSMTGNLYNINDIVVADGKAFVLDRVRTAVFRVNVAENKISGGLRAGTGATNAAVDSHGRILVTDTRGGALLAFGTEPFLMRQRFPVPGGIYGIAYDNKRDLTWVTLTKRNEVVGYDMTGGQPVEEYRFPTVRQPNSVTVDERTGRVIVASAVGEGMQVITP